MNNMLFDNCEISHSGYKSAKCDLDAKDGWDMMHDATFKNLTFMIILIMIF